jgi:hypothetical protein
MRADAPTRLGKDLGMPRLLRAVLVTVAAFALAVVALSAFSTVDASAASGYWAGFWSWTGRAWIWTWVWVSTPGGWIIR